ncbi:MAG: 1,4-dihydroxy-2-naphthoate octaprenyltransferase [Bifidobacteriaceae bacterium]|nr:1,4-dihydroxy-2-naphthoate octaprenyltransferase [Bifidobacteriaceae bacterium]
MRNAVVAGMRLRTIPVGIAPVLVGACAAWREIRVLGAPAPFLMGWFFAAMAVCLGVSVGLQIAVNFTNDYSDGIRGVDAARLGDESATGKPRRMVASGLMTPSRVLICAAVFAVVACACGVVAACWSQAWWLIALGPVFLLAGWFYVGGKHPYGYHGWGEIFVFLFFGLAATVGSQYVIARTVMVRSLLVVPISRAYMLSMWPSLGPAVPASWGVTWLGWLSATVVGLNAVAVLMVNNLRDVDDDRAGGKRTLTVILGRLRSWNLLIGICAVATIMSFEVALYEAWWWGLPVGMLLPTLQAWLLVSVKRGDYQSALAVASLVVLVFAALDVLWIAV